MNGLHKELSLEKQNAFLQELESGVSVNIFPKGGEHVTEPPD